MNAEGLMSTQPQEISPQPEPVLPAVAAGNALAAEQCVDRYAALVWSIVRRAIPDYTKAEDVVQEVFISIMKAAGTFDPDKGSETVFVTTIARRRLVDQYRRIQRVPEPEDLDEMVVAKEDMGLASVEVRDEVQVALQAIDTLGPKQRSLFDLWVVKGMTHNEIATHTGIPLGTVKSQMRRGLIQVREMLQGGSLMSSPEVSS
ncbi:MAG: RNA polymerase sigma factor (sigma-70 family) [Planctomycetota bacterium]|jgi:RNA polymerase sigma factor (sigma-70 family)